MALRRTAGREVVVPEARGKGVDVRAGGAGSLFGCGHDALALDRLVAAVERALRVRDEAVHGLHALLAHDLDGRVVRFLRRVAGKAQAGVDLQTERRSLARARVLARLAR